MDAAEQDDDSSEDKAEEEEAQGSAEERSKVTTVIADDCACSLSHLTPLPRLGRLRTAPITRTSCASGRWLCGCRSRSRSSRPMRQQQQQQKQKQKAEGCKRSSKQLTEGCPACAGGHFAHTCSRAFSTPLLAHAAYPQTDQKSTAYARAASRTATSCSWRRHQAQGQRPEGEPEQALKGQAAQGLGRSAE